MSVTRVIAIAGFLLAASLFVTIEWLARREKSRIPTMGDLTAYVMGYEVGRLPIGRIAVIGFWWWVGWHFFAR